MEYYAVLDVSMEETHICVVDRDGGVVHETKVASTPADIDAALMEAPACRRVVFETGRMAPMLYHGLVQRGVPVVCIESRQTYQALKSLTTHKTDRNDARGLAQLARTGFFKPVHVKSLAAHAIRSLIVARKKLVGQRVTLENQIRGLAVAFGVRLPRSLGPAFIEQALSASDGVDGLSAAMQGLIAARSAVMAAGRDRHRHQKDGEGVRRAPSSHDHSWRRPIDGARLCGGGRRPRTLQAIARYRRLFRPRAPALSVRRDGLHWRHLQMRRQAGADAAL